MTRAQIITTIAGNHKNGFSGAGGPALNAEMGLMYGIAVDKAGNVYAADQQNNVIWKISPGGSINFFAGNGTIGYSGDGGPASQALLYAPAWLGIDPAGDLYFTDQAGIYIRKINAAGAISTVAGNSAAHYSGGDGGPFTSATFYSITGIVFDPAGNMYISDNNRVRKVGATGIINTIAGTGTSGYSGDGGAATAAQLDEPYGVAIDGAGNIYIPDANNNIIRKVNPAGIISTIAGISQSAGYSGDGGPAVNAKFDYPWAVTVDNNGTLYVSDQGNWVIRTIDANGIINNYAGDHLLGYSGDGGPAGAAEISYPDALAFDQAGNLYLTDLYNYVVRKISGCAAGSAIPTVSISTPQTSVCAGMPVTFTAVPNNSGGNPSFQWEVNGVAAGTGSSVFTAAGLPAGGDTVSCLMSSMGTCGVPVASNAIVMTVNPVPYVGLPPDTLIALGQSVHLISVVGIGVGDSIVSYQWMPATGLSNASSPGPDAMPEVSTTYQLTVRLNGGCSGSDTVTIGVYRRFQVPNAFTPDGNGKNAIFRVPPTAGVTVISFSVYNRLGGRVFSTSGGDIGWDGRTGGVKQPAGVYVWEIEYADVLTGKPVRIAGTVLLIR